MEPLKKAGEGGDAAAEEVVEGRKSRFRLTRVGTRTQICEEEGGESRRCENWQFDEDSYTVGVYNLFHLKLPAALPCVFVALIAPGLQSFICWQVFLYLDDHKPDTTGTGTSAKVVCSFLCVLQISDEAVEGLHKMIFCMRWALGIYDGRAPMSAAVGFALGFTQLLMGVATCQLCIMVIFTSQTTLDTFFNYVALAFIANVDNMMMGSRVVRGFLDVNTEFQASWSSNDLVTEKLQWARLALVVFVTCFACVIPFSVFTNIEHSAHLDPPVEFQWLLSIPRALVVLLVFVALMKYLSLWLGTCKASLAVTMASIVLQLVLFGSRMAMQDPSDQACFWFGPLERSVLWIFSTMTLPIGCAAELESFNAMKLIPVMTKLIMMTGLIWIFELGRFGCA